MGAVCELSGCVEVKVMEGLAAQLKYTQIVRLFVELNTWRRSDENRNS